MAISPNYSWPLPDDTDLVKNGAEAIRDLGNAIDTTVDGLPSGGLVHIETQTVSSGVSAVNFNNVFTATYDTYLATGYIIHSSTNSGLLFRLRNSGTDRSGTDYDYQRIEFFNTTANNSSRSNIAFTELGATNNSSGGVFSINFYNPFSVTTTGLSARGGAQERTRITFGGYDEAESQDGFSIISESGTWASGFVSVYGLVKA